MIRKLGIAVPPSNPAAEPEMRDLLPAGITAYATRLAAVGEPAQRIRDYLVDIESACASFDGLPLDCLAFACTASSYLLGACAAQEKACEAERRFGFPVVLAADAITSALRYLNARQIALVCPYPGWLLQAANEFWAAQDFEVIDSFSLQPDAGDTRQIYSLDPARHLKAVETRWSAVGADVFLIAGTGMPGLGLVNELSRVLQRPVLNSSLCLAWACLREMQVDTTTSTLFPLLDGWQQRWRQSQCGNLSVHEHNPAPASAPAAP